MGFSHYSDEEDGDLLPFGAAAATGALAHDLAEATKSITEQLTELRSQMDSLKGEDGLDSIRKRMDVLHDYQTQALAAQREQAQAVQPAVTSSTPEKEPQPEPTPYSSPLNVQPMDSAASHAVQGNARDASWLFASWIISRSVMLVALLALAELARLYVLDAGWLEGSHLLFILGDADTPWYNAEVAEL